MTDECPEGEYRDKETGKCRKSIVVKKEGVYGKGFLSEPQEEQYAKIERVEKKEPPAEVHEQLAALNSFESNTPHHEAAEKDLKFSEETDPVTANKCLPDEEYVERYIKDDGTEVKGYCRRIGARERSGWKKRQ
jgi:hypothetical protein